MPPGRLTGRAALAAAIVVAALALGPATPSSAHNSRTVFTGVFGPYDVVGTARYAHETEHGVMLDLLVRTEDSRRPVDDASVRVQGNSGTRATGPLEADRYGNTYRVVLPGDDAAHWQIEATIDGEPGTTTFTRTIPGPLDLRGDTGGMWGPEDTPGSAWLATTICALVLVGAAGLTRWWRQVMWTAGLVLLGSCGAALAASWSEATAPTVAKVAALPAPLLAAGLLAAGLATSRDRRDESLLLVFVGAAGLAVLFGLFNRSFLTADVPSTLPPTLARTSVAVASGLGGGLALLVTACHRDKLRALITPSHQPR